MFYVEYIIFHLREQISPPVSVALCYFGVGWNSCDQLLP